MEELFINYFSQEQFLGDASVLKAAAAKVGLEGADAIIDDESALLEEVEDELHAQRARESARRRTEALPETPRRRAGAVCSRRHAGRFRVAYEGAGVRSEAGRRARLARAPTESRPTISAPQRPMSICGP